ncbi:MAG: hypothetical protein Kow00121_60380 [Elainellaceae cyanobacterium]
MKPFSIHANYVAWGYLVLLILGFLSVGWLLAAFQVSWLIWLGTMAITLHLAHAGTDAIAIATAWIATIISIGAVIKAWAPIWDSRVPWENARLWASGLLLIWLGTTTTGLLLAFAQQPLRSLNWDTNVCSRSLLVLTWSAMACGWLLYQISLQ